MVVKARGARTEGVDVFEVRAAGEDLVVISLPVEARAQRPAMTLAEREITTDVLAGLSTAEIARRRGRSPRTIANQLASIYRKLGVASRAELAVLLFGEDES